MGTNAKLDILKTKKARVSTRLLIDVPLVVAVVMLLFLGMLALYSASWNYAYQQYDNGGYIVLRQILWVAIGLVMATFVAFLDYHVLEHFALAIILGTSLLLFIVLLIPSNIQGATRTIFNGSIQPSELAKLSILIFLSYWLSYKQEVLGSLTLGLIPVLGMIFIIAFLILIQPDLSAAITVVALGMIMFTVAGGNKRHIFMLFVIGFLALVVGYFLFSKVSTRIDDWKFGFFNPELASYHIQRSTEAILRGGWFGVGIGKGVVKLTGLPVAWTDSIYSVILEETGIFGGSFFIILYLVILWRGYVISTQAPDVFGKLLAAGISIWIGLEAFMNIGVLVNVLPFAGNALPFVSSGGSSMILSLTGVGILISISRISAIINLKNERTTPDAIVDLRGWDRGWRISSLGRNPRKR